MGLSEGTSVISGHKFPQQPPKQPPDQNEESRLLDGFSNLLAYIVFMAPEVGLEPTTLRLTAECSAIELLRIAWETLATGRLLLYRYSKCARVGQRSAILFSSALFCSSTLRSPAMPRIRRLSRSEVGPNFATSTTSSSATAATSPTSSAPSPTDRRSCRPWPRT